MYSGHNGPGIYSSWFGPDGARAQVNGFSGGCSERVNSLAEAELRLAASVDHTPSSGHRSDHLPRRDTKPPTTDPHPQPVRGSYNCCTALCLLQRGATDIATFSRKGLSCTFCVRIHCRHHSQTVYLRTEDILPHYEVCPCDGDRAKCKVTTDIPSASRGAINTERDSSLTSSQTQIDPRVSADLNLHLEFLDTAKTQRDQAAARLVSTRSELTDTLLDIAAREAEVEDEETYQGVSQAFTTFTEDSEDSDTGSFGSPLPDSGLATDSREKEGTPQPAPTPSREYRNYVKCYSRQLPEAQRTEASSASPSARRTARQPKLTARKTAPSGTNKGYVKVLAKGTAIRSYKGLASGGTFRRDRSVKRKRTEPALASPSSPG